MPKNTNNSTVIEKTKDGSDTLYSSRFDQTYHNQQGAVSESEHIFFETNGLNQALKNNDKINILEIGFGTGLNLLLLMDKHRKYHSSAQINYHAIEAYPAKAQTIESLNYKEFLDQPKLAAALPPLFSKLTKGMNHFELSPNISVHIFYGLFADYTILGSAFDFIFHDAFSPRVNPELWTGDTFKKIITASKKDALLTTYCAASKVRGAMAHSGWNVARARGALGKREMTIASPSPEKLASFKRVNEERLAKRFEQNDF